MRKCIATNLPQGSARRCVVEHHREALLKEEINARLI